MSRLIENISKRILSCFFYNLYHRFAFLYDLVAAIVSQGHWKAWTYQVIPFVKGPAVLEIGHGPGHLLKKISVSGFKAFGLDESRQMGLIAKKNYYTCVEDAPPQPAPIARAGADSMPFPSNIFDTVVATFPAPFILDETTLREIHRVVQTDGSLVILLSVWIIGTGLYEKLLSGLYSVTHESPTEQDLEQYRVPFEKAGFHTSFHFINFRSARLFLILATKKE
jgi:SAM-dependent methyltransferase